VRERLFQEQRRNVSLRVTEFGCADQGPEKPRAAYTAGSNRQGRFISQALKNEVGSKGVTVQAVLPGATATPLWEKAGRPVEHLPSEIVMTAEDMVDASLAGLDRHELITIPSLPDIADWETFEAARKALGPNLSRQKPAARYGIQS
jgi:short-subunit dehydrogenase